MFTVLLRYVKGIIKYDYLSTVLQIRENLLILQQMTSVFEMLKRRPR